MSSTPFSRHRDGFIISTDRARLDVDLIHAYLSREAYWAIGRTRAVVVKSIEHSLCFGVYAGVDQVGLARVITDYATFGYLADVFIISAFRRRGLGKWLVDTVVGHPDICDLRRLFLFTADAHNLYRQFGFETYPTPAKAMERIGQRAGTARGTPAPNR